MNRRGFFSAMIAPIAAKALPKDRPNSNIDARNVAAVTLFSPMYRSRFYKNVINGASLEKLNREINRVGAKSDALIINYLNGGDIPGEDVSCH